MPCSGCPGPLCGANAFGIDREQRCAVRHDWGLPPRGHTPLPVAAHPTKSPQLLATGVAEKNDRLCPVIANGLDRAAFLGFLAASFFLRRLRLF
jgi:hypothetical protein